MLRLIFIWALICSNENRAQHCSKNKRNLVNDAFFRIKFLCVFGKNLTGHSTFNDNLIFLKFHANSMENLYTDGMFYFFNTVAGSHCDYSHLSNKREVTLIDFEKKNHPPLLVYCSYVYFFPKNPTLHLLHSVLRWN